MKIPHNTFKEAIKAGRTQLGLWLISTSPYLAEIAATSGYDWLLIDGEHGPNDVPTILAQLQAVAPYSSQAIVRTVNHDPALIKQILDCGAQTLLIPMVDTAQQARDLVAAMRYPRDGVRGLRGVAPISARASRWGRIADYTDRVEEELCLLVQIESQRGLDNLDEITQVEGVDGVFIGPADLSASMGHLDNPGHPDVKTAIEQAIRRICQLGKAAGIISVDPALARLHISCGASFVAIAVDTMLFTKAIDEAWQRTQAELAR